MILRPDQVPVLLDAAEAISGHRLIRLRRKLADENSDAHQLELATLMAALSVCDVVPEPEEDGAQPPSAPDVHCVLPSQQRVMIECRHVGADLSSHDSLRPPLNVEFSVRVEDELLRAGVENGRRVSLSYWTESGEATRFPPRASFDALFASPGFHEFVRHLQEAGDGRGLWHVQEHGFNVEAAGFGSFERMQQLPPDFRDHPVYRGIKDKMRQVAKLATPQAPVVLLLAVTNATMVVRGAATRWNWDSRQVCRAAFGVSGVGDQLVGPNGITTLGRIQGGERLAAAMVLELSPRSYWPPHSDLQVVLNPNAEHPLTRAHLDILGSMFFITHHGPSLDAETLRTQYPLRRAAMAWNAKPIEQRQAEFDASIVAANDGTEAVGELAEFYKRGLSVSVPELLLRIWPAL